MSGNVIINEETFVEIDIVNSNLDAVFDVALERGVKQGKMKPTCELHLSCSLKSTNN